MNLSPRNLLPVRWLRRLFSKRGDHANRARQWKRAERYYRIALAVDPRRPETWVQYGHARKECGALRAAERAYRRAIDLQPVNADSFIQLGHALKLQGRFDEAFAAYRWARKLDPASALARAEVENGWLLERIGSYISNKPGYLSMRHRDWVRMVDSN